MLVTLFIGAPLLAAMLGWLGGGAGRTTMVRTKEARLTIQSPDILRSGNWFETLVTVEPTADVVDLTIEIDRRLWQGMSIDTLVPDAERASSDGGVFRYSFGHVRRGERFVLKLDGQMQPHGFRRLSGQLTARDGERLLSQAPLGITVLP